MILKKNPYPRFGLCKEEDLRIAPIIIMLLDGATLSAQVAGNKNSANDAWQIVEEIIL